MSTTLLYKPNLEERPETVGKLAMRRVPTDGLRITILNNGKAKTLQLLNHVVDEIRRDYRVASVSVHSKPSAAFVVDSDSADRIAASSDLVIAGLGDCGACSSCSLHDALQMERMGVPAAVIITEPFIDVCSRTATRLGYPGYQPVVVPHPLASRSDEAIARIAARAAEALVTLALPSAPSRITV